MAGAIKTGVVTKEYEDGWESTFGRKSHAAAVTYRQETLPVVMSGLDEPERAPRREQMAETRTYVYDCPVCGWHRETDTEPCGNATCRSARRARR